MLTPKSIATLTFILASAVNSTAGAAPEIPDPSLNDIARVSWWSGPIPPLGIPMYNGPIIFFNPIVVQQAGPALTSFFYAHEYCHIHLNHIQQQMFMSNPYNMAWLSQTLESQADSCATQALIQQGNMQAIYAAVQWFYGQGPVQLSITHPPGQARAMNIVSTAHSLGVQI